MKSEKFANFICKKSQKRKPQTSNSQNSQNSAKRIKTDKTTNKYNFAFLKISKFSSILKKNPKISCTLLSTCSIGRGTTSICAEKRRCCWSGAARRLPAWASPSSSSGRLRLLRPVQWFSFRCVPLLFG